MLFDDPSVQLAPLPGDALIADFRGFAGQRPAGGYRAILADPPWSFDNYSAKGEAKNAKAHYSCVPMTILRALPVSLVAARNCALFLWATSPLLDQQIDCMQAWGFRYLGFDAWFKGSPKSAGEPGDATWKPNMGPGYIRRGASELILIGAIGEPEWQPACRGMRNVLFDPAREHSRKPDAQYSRVEQSVPGPYLEIFSRTSRPGWSHFGNQTGFFGEVS
jgi:N6-adenosine-specific RNA methylase IME4